MSDWDAPTITISKRTAVPKVTKKEGEINGQPLLNPIVFTAHSAQLLVVQVLWSAQTKK